MHPRSQLWLALTGGLLVVLGIYCIASPGVALASAAWAVGLLTLVSGVSSLLFALDAQTVLPNAGSMTLSAVLRILIGIFFLAHSLLLAVSLSVLFAIWIIFESVYLTTQSLSLRKAGARGWWVVALLGIGGLVLGIGALCQPESAASLLGTLVGIGVLAAGIARLVALADIRRINALLNGRM